MFNWSPCIVVDQPHGAENRNLSGKGMCKTNIYHNCADGEAAKKFFLSGPATKAFTPRLGGHRNFFFRLKIAGNGF